MDLQHILEEHPASFGDVSRTLCELVNYITELEDRISELEGKMCMIEDRSDLLQSSEERYYQ